MEGTMQVLLLTLVSIATIAAVGGAAEEVIGEKPNIGHDLSVHEATKKSQYIFIGLLLAEGATQPNPPGEATYDNGRVKVERIFKGNLENEIRISYRVRSLPKPVAENAPKVNHRYVFFVGKSDDKLVVLKALSSNSEIIDCIDAVTQLSANLSGELKAKASP